MFEILQRFLRDTRSAGTGLAAATVTVVAIGGGAVLVDHVWLVEQRDILKSASDAAAVAATLELNRQLFLDGNIADDDLTAILEEVSRRYIALNLMHLSAGRLADALSTLLIKVTSDRSNGAVEVLATADLGGFLFSPHIPLFSNVPSPDPMQAMAKVESTKVPVEVVLAIDVSGSMTRSLAGTANVPEEESRMALVKDAALALVEVLDPDSNHRIAIGIVPWHFLVRLDDSMRERWARFDWAKYPDSRYYAEPFRKRYGWLPGPEGVTQALPPTAPETWLGCLDEHRISSGAGPAELAPTQAWNGPPQHVAFAQAFYPALDDHAYECAPDPLPDNYGFQYCYTEVTSVELARQRLHSPQHGCASDGAPIVPLTSNRATIEDGIKALEAVGDTTYSPLGVLWAQRMLSPPWKRIWGSGVHPLDSNAKENEGLRKAIVLLTDGEDNYCGSSPGACVDSALGIDRSEACTFAKSEGSEIFVVTAMSPDEVSGDLAKSLLECSSEAENPGGTYTFINNEDEESLRAAFLGIANQLVVIRKVY